MNSHQARRRGAAFLLGGEGGREERGVGTEP